MMEERLEREEDTWITKKSDADEEINKEEGRKISDGCTSEESQTFDGDGGNIEEREREVCSCDKIQ